MVFAGPSGLDVLARAKHFIVDGTFDLCEESLIVTTIMAYQHGVAIPCAWLLSDSKERENYKKFFEVIKVATGNRMNPESLLVDFEEALSGAWLDVFPQSMISHDFFHFQQCIVKNAKKMGLTELVVEIAADTRELWNAPTKFVFDELTQVFVNKWKPRIPQFITYFENTWLKRFKPDTWASFGRPDDVPSGSGALEGYHNRIQNVIFPDNPQAVDKIALSLWEEELFFGKVRASPDLWWERVAMVERRQEYYQRSKEKNTSARVTLKDYIDIPELALESTESHASKKRKDRPQEGMCECGEYKFNKSCSLKMCRKCCIRSPFPCTVTDHKLSKEVSGMYFNEKLIGKR